MKVIPETLNVISTFLLPSLGRCLRILVNLRGEGIIRPIVSVSALHGLLDISIIEMFSS